MPVWEAYYVLTIASKTGWSEEFIRHQLPLARGNAYYHGVRLMEGEHCRWPGRPSPLASYLDKSFAWIRAKLKSTRGR